MAGHDLDAAAFPRLDEAQLKALGRCAGASLQRYRAGERLFTAGDRDFKFFVVKSGEIEIRDEFGDRPRTLAILGPGEFRGPALVSAIALRDCEVHEVSSEGAREILNRFPGLGDVILQAFIARRQLLRESGNLPACG